MLIFPEVDHLKYCKNLKPSNLDKHPCFFFLQFIIGTVSSRDINLQGNNLNQAQYLNITFNTFTSPYGS
ncbi:hypothetical protein BpHYR1_033030 [Brachionus plicatilis]|uniref:Uncharacterized protein n=1 Tax=Brachionus plicatilis TaxID=10195 RepID=A0A3M7P4U5_BRAPC|nr:hypothetical protein BpHYR1_033030 [Brachionus plicatilis]